MVCKCVNIRVQLVIVWRNRGYAWLMVMLVPLRMLVYIAWHSMVVKSTDAAKIKAKVSVALSPVIP